MENTLSWVRSIITTTPARWISLTENLPVELLTRAPLAGEWSAVECLLHLIDVEQVITIRIKAFLAGQDFPGFNPDQEGTKLAGSPAPLALAQEFARLRSANMSLLSQVGETDLDRQARHQELGLVTMNQLMHEWAAHDLNHTIQAERALIQPFIQGCGPWKIFFTDQLAMDK
jgi:hypothetical protein